MATSHDILSCVLLNKWAAVDADKDEDTATAFSTTGEGEPIRVSFRGADPPALSNLAVLVSDRRRTANFRMMPKILSADAGLFVLRVPHYLFGSLGVHYSDYFVYRVDATCPGLHRLPELDEATFRDQEVAILSCSAGDYVVAALTNRPDWGRTFRLYMCRSTDGKLPERWTSQVLFVEEPLRDVVYPVPASARLQEYHVTTKVIMLGGDEGTIGWVDLWRGIILCNVLSEKPKLRDMPLPLPSRESRISFRNSDPYFFRDITVNKFKNTIKYVEMIMRPREVPFTHSSYGMVVPGSWMATTYTMPIPVTSWDKWCPGGYIHSNDLVVPVDSEYYDLLCEIMISNDSTEEATEATCLSLQSLQMAHPALSTGDDDIIYMLCMGCSMEGIKAVKAMVGVDTRAGILQGVARVGADINLSLIVRDYLASRIPKDLKATGTSASAGQDNKINVEEEDAGRSSYDIASTDDAQVLNLMAEEFAGLIEGLDLVEGV